MKTVTIILREASESALQTAIQDKEDESFVLLGPASVILDSTDTEIWYCTMQGSEAVEPVA